MLIGTAAWLLYRRLLYGPLMLLVWWPLRILFGTGVKVGSAVGGLGAAGRSGGESMVIGGDGSGRTVAGVTGAAAMPTVSVAGGGTTSQTETGAEPDSMVEQVGHIVDGQQAQSQEGAASSEEQRQQQGQGQEDQPNPKKRMWEEEKEAAKHAERVKDEL